MTLLDLRLWRELDAWDLGFGALGLLSIWALYVICHAWLAGAYDPNWGDDEEFEKYQPDWWNREYED